MRTNRPVELVTGLAVDAVRDVRSARSRPPPPAPRVPGRTTPDTGRPVIVRGLHIYLLIPLYELQPDSLTWNSNSGSFWFG